MKDWYKSHSPREQAMLAAGTIAIVIGLFFFAVLNPLLSSLDQRRARVAGNSNSAAWLQKAAGEAIALRGGGAVVNADTSQAPLTAVAQAFKQAGLKNPSRVDPVGNKGARVQISEIAFDKLIPVLDKLER